jgi:hypothetical protein
MLARRVTGSGAGGATTCAMASIDAGRTLPHDYDAKDDDTADAAGGGHAAEKEPDRLACAHGCGTGLEAGGGGGGGAATTGGGSMVNEPVRLACAHGWATGAEACGTAATVGAGVCDGPEPEARFCSIQGCCTAVAATIGVLAPEETGVVVGADADPTICKALGRAFCQGCSGALDDGATGSIGAAGGAADRALFGCQVRGAATGAGASLTVDSWLKLPPDEIEPELRTRESCEPPLVRGDGLAILVIER